MILFFVGKTQILFAVGTSDKLPEKEIEKLIWLFGEASIIPKDKVEGVFVGPRDGDTLEHKCC